MEAEQKDRRKTFINEQQVKRNEKMQQNRVVEDREDRSEKTGVFSQTYLPKLRRPKRMRQPEESMGYRKKATVDSDIDDLLVDLAQRKNNEDAGSVPSDFSSVTDSFLSARSKAASVQSQRSKNSIAAPAQSRNSIAPSQVSRNSRAPSQVSKKKQSSFPIKQSSRKNDGNTFYDTTTRN